LKKTKDLRIRSPRIGQNNAEIGLTLTGFIFVAFLGISRHYTSYFRMASTFATIDTFRKKKAFT